MYKEYCVWYVCCFCTGNVQFVASLGWREKFIRRHPEVRTKVTEVGTYLCEDICSVGDPCCCGGTNPKTVLYFLEFATHKSGWNELRCCWELFCHSWHSD